MKILLAACLALAVTTPLLAQTAQLKADHIYVFVSPGGEQEAAALRALGFQVDSAVTKHVGGGTASRSVIFENFYLELIWVDSTVTVSEASTASFADMQRAAAWRTSGASPFGLGLRKIGGPDEYGVSTTRYTDAWMKEGTASIVLTQPDEPKVFGVFVVPEYMAVPAWIDRAREFTVHPNGSGRVTALEIHGPVSHHPKVLTTLAVPILRVVESSAPLLIIEFDGGKAAQRHELRPLMPFLIRR